MEDDPTRLLRSDLTTLIGPLIRQPESHLVTPYATQESVDELHEMLVELRGLVDDLLLAQEVHTEALTAILKHLYTR
jgi:hypothetical protein